MADKEATVYVVDVGKPMGETHHGRSVSDLDWAMQYIWDKITATVATGRKTACAGVLGFRTDATSHLLSGEEGYENISVFKGLGQILMPDLRTIRERITPSKTKRGDAITAVVVAIQMIAEFCKKLKYKKKIVLVTNGDGSMDLDGISSIADKLRDEAIELVILGADFDDPDFGVKEEDKPSTKSTNEAALKDLVSQCDGVFGTLQQAISELGIPRVKAVRPVATYKGKLRLGNPEEYESAMEIDIERYPRTMIATAPTSTRFAVKPEAPDQPAGMDIDQLEDQQANGPDPGVVRQVRSYEVKDNSAPGGKREVDRDDLAKGYTYGTTAVHIEQSDENVTRLETMPGLEIVGFVPMDNYEHYMSMSRTSVIIAQRANDLAAMALSAFIHALYELNSCAVARMVTKEWRPPSLLLLSPSIDVDFECLIDMELPFAEDFRQHKFPPLDRILTVSGKILTEHRSLPSQKLKDAMGAYVDSMDLSMADEEDGEPAEYMKMEDTFSPKLHRIHQAIQHRAVHPDAPVPAPPEALTRFSHPPADLVKSAAPQLEALRSVADVKKVPPITRGRRHTLHKKNHDAPRSGLDVQALLSSRAARNANQISPANAVPEFKQALDAADSIEQVERACRQLGDIVRTWVTESIGDGAYGRAVEALRVMREAALDFEVPRAYNAFLADFKADVFAEKLGGDRREMWYAVRTGRLGPIHKGVDANSDFSEEDARLFVLPDRSAAA